jgi:hypothetical protein
MIKLFSLYCWIQLLITKFLFPRQTWGPSKIGASFPYNQTLNASLNMSFENLFKLFTNMANKFFNIKHKNLMGG